MKYSRQKIVVLYKLIILKSICSKDALITFCDEISLFKKVSLKRRSNVLMQLITPLVYIAVVETNGLYR